MTNQGYADKNLPHSKWGGPFFKTEHLSPLYVPHEFQHHTFLPASWDRFVSESQRHVTATSFALCRCHIGIASTLLVSYGYSFHSTGVLWVQLSLYRCHMGIASTLPVSYGYSFHSTGVIWV